MSKPEIYPEQSAAGIAQDPRTLDRVIPESKRSDGSVRKEIRIRPGFTPQEDVSRFRGSRQQQMDRNALPKGHIVGWVAPSSETTAKPAAASKSAAKNAKRREKKAVEKEAEKNRKILESWEDEDDNSPASVPAISNNKSEADASNLTPADDPQVACEDKNVDDVVDKLDALKVK